MCMIVIELYIETKRQNKKKRYYESLLSVNSQVHVFYDKFTAVSETLEV